MDSFDLDCAILSFNWNQVEEVDHCMTENLNITTKNETITSVNGGTEPTNIEGLWLSEQNIHYLPKGIDKFFPNLKFLIVKRANLKSLAKDDFKSLPELVYLSFSDNNLESLDGDLFDFNPKINHLDFSSNNLKYIGGNILSNLKELHRSYFFNNTCISEIVFAPSHIPDLIQNLRTECSELKLIEVNDKLNEEIAKLKRWLVSCDGNLNATTEIIFKTNDRQQIFMQTSSEPLELIVEIDGLSVTASKFVISSYGVMINLLAVTFKPSISTINSNGSEDVCMEICWRSLLLNIIPVVEFKFPSHDTSHRFNFAISSFNLSFSSINFNSLHSVLRF